MGKCETKRTKNGRLNPNISLTLRSKYTIFKAEMDVLTQIKIKVKYNNSHKPTVCCLQVTHFNHIGRLKVKEWKIYIMKMLIKTKNRNGSLIVKKIDFRSEKITRHKQ